MLISHCSHGSHCPPRSSQSFLKGTITQSPIALYNGILRWYVEKTHGMHLVSSLVFCAMWPARKVVDLLILLLRSAKLHAVCSKEIALLLLSTLLVGDMWMEVARRVCLNVE